MKKVLILLPLLFLVKGNTTAQSLTKNQADYFILGTLSDSEGRVANVDGKDELDYYFQWEKPLVSLVDSILKVNYPITTFELKQNQHPEGIQRYFFIYSDSLCNKFNRYYEFKPTGTSTYPDDNTEYYGVLNDNIFRSDDQKLAFLAGVYVRFGEKTDTAYSIHISESPSKVKACYDLLKEFKCKSTYKVINNIPTQVFVYFHPTEGIKADLKRYDRLNTEIQKTRNLIFKKIYDQYRKKSNAKNPHG
jgi:hypothetical protein